MWPVQEPESIFLCHCIRPFRRCARVCMSVCVGGCIHCHHRQPCNILHTNCSINVKMDYLSGRSGSVLAARHMILDNLKQHPTHKKMFRSVSEPAFWSLRQWQFQTFLHGAGGQGFWQGDIVQQCVCVQGFVHISVQPYKNKP